MSHPGRSRARSFGARGGGSMMPGRGPPQRGDDDVSSRFSELSMQQRGAGHGRDERSSQYSTGPMGGRSSGYDRGGSRTSNRGTHGSYGQGGDRGPRPTYYSSHPDAEQYEIIRESNVPSGSSGRRVQLLANYFKITVDPIIVYHHDLDFRFAREEDKARFRDNEKLQKYFSDAAPTLFQKFVEINSDQFLDFRIVYDNGRNLYCTENLESKPMIKELEIEFRGKKTYRIELKMVQKIDFSLVEEYYRKKMNLIPGVPVQCLELMFQNVAATKFLLHNHKFFDSDMSKLGRSPREWIRFAQGFSSAVRFTEFGTALNMHLKTSCMISPSVETLEQLVRMITGHDPSDFNRSDIENCSRIIRGLKVFTTHLGRQAVYTMRGLFNPPKECKFSCKSNGDGNGDGKEETISVHEYFLKKYQITLKNYPTVEMTGKKNHLIPLELCYMVDKQFLNNTKIDSAVQNDLLTASTHKPIIYMNTITRFAQELQKLDPDLMTRNFGTDLIPKPAKFYGRVLDAPKQKGGKRNEQFVSTPERPEFAFFSFDSQFGLRDLDQIVRDLRSTGSRMGMDLSNCVAKDVVPISMNNIRVIPNVFCNIMKSFPNLQLLFIALPPVPALYNLVKQVGDQKVGIVTQCVLASKARNRRGGYIENILLKVNGKLGGRNSIILDTELKKLSFDYTKTMVIGIDVNHPGQTEKIESSIACAVGSYDHSFALYTASIKVQKKNRMEIIDCLEPMIIELMEEYRKKNGYFPENVFAFRDGVSDGQFQHAESEVKQLRVGGGKCVKNFKLVYIVVQKGHHTRFVLAEPTGQDRFATYNVPAGTVVDSAIVEPSQHMFFINSHFSPLGTSRPLKYVVLHNEFEQRSMTNDDLQRFCFYCCHNCTRFRGTIALPTPVRYADLCAYRSKLHLEAQTANAREKLGKEGMVENFEERVIMQLNNWVKVHERARKVLYYC